MSKQLLLLFILLTHSACRHYPLYKQNDRQWAQERLGNGSNTIAKAGCLITSVAMALTAIGRSFNPSTLNGWLKAHSGYFSNDLFIWGSVGSLGLEYAGKVSNDKIKTALSRDEVVMVNVMNGVHWVLAIYMKGDTIFVNDPLFNTHSYELSDIIGSNSGCFCVR
jgi:hypothetical protein